MAIKGAIMVGGGPTRSSTLKRSPQSYRHFTNLKAGNRSSYAIADWWQSTSKNERLEAFQFEFGRSRLQVQSFRDRILVPDDISPQEILAKIITGESVVEDSQAIPLEIDSLFWDRFDLRSLNSFESGFFDDGIGLYRLLYGVALLLDNFKLGTATLYRPFKTDFKKRGWNQPQVPWKEGLAITTHINWEQYGGVDGYDQFAQQFLGGNSLRTSLFVRFLLSKEDFNELSWGKTKTTKVKNQSKIKKALLSGKYKFEEGYDRFALEFFEGYSQKAFSAARSLLSSKEYYDLHWPKCKSTNVKDQDSIRKALKLKKYLGKTGYDQFALDYFEGSLARAYQVASSLLSDSDFAKLQWGKLLTIRVEDKQRLLKALKSEVYKGEAGYDQFALDYFDGKSLKAWNVASALLSEKGFNRLNWGSQKQTNVSEQTQLREALNLDKYKGVMGYDQFALDFFLGDSEKAYSVASSLLATDKFKALEWGRLKKTNVNEQKQIKDELLSHKFNGEEGYDLFAVTYFEGRSQVAFQVASSLLNEVEFQQLNWPRVKHTNVAEQEILRTSLLSGDYNGVKGYERFALEFCTGNMYKAYLYAKSVLSNTEYKKLGWQIRRDKLI